MAKRSGFTLIETCIAMSVLSLLLGLLLSGVQAARDSSARGSCQNRMRQMTLAVMQYEQVEQCLPPRKILNGRPLLSAPEGVLSWQVLILPYLDRDALYRSAVADCAVTYRTFDLPLHSGYSLPLSAFACPADGRFPMVISGPLGKPAALGSYLGVAGHYNSKGLFQPGLIDGEMGVRLSTTTDGLSQTLLIGERPPPDGGSGRWYSGNWKFAPFFGPEGYMTIPATFLSPDIEVRCQRVAIPSYGPGNDAYPCDAYHFWSHHRIGANFAFADGHVRLISYDIGRDVLISLSTRAGGETIGDY